MFMKNKHFYLPSYVELCTKLTIKSKLADKFAESALLFLFDFYLNDQLLTKNLIDMKLNFMYSYGRLDNPKYLVSNSPKLKLSISYDNYPIHSDNEQTFDLLMSESLTINNSVILTNYELPVGMWQKTLVNNKLELSKPKITVKDALEYIKNNLQKAAYKYTIFATDKVEDVQNYKVIGDEIFINTSKRSYLVDPFTDSRFSVIGNPLFNKLCSGFPMPMHPNLRPMHLDYAINLARFSIGQEGYDTSIADQSLILKIVEDIPTHKVEVINLLYKSIFYDVLSD